MFLTSTHLGIAMEYASGGELFDRIVKANRFSEDEARYFFQQLISGVAWCHREVGSGGGGERRCGSGGRTWGWGPAWGCGRWGSASGAATACCRGFGHICVLLLLLLAHLPLLLLGQAGSATEPSVCERCAHAWLLLAWLSWFGHLLPRLGRSGSQNASSSSCMRRETGRSSFPLAACALLPSKPPPCPRVAAGCVPP